MYKVKFSYLMSNVLVSRSDMKKSHMLVKLANTYGPDDFFPPSNNLNSAAL